ncbi:uncharacterized protein Panc/cmk_0 isoform X2 [Zeugodacus cucurbitae]|uniref:Bifunctional pantoate ligase/cytidylate kinase n=1 Tax=Zeugodacus cucurbitae TaxID=28588 RepID=A0A0A1WV95_ZEUCU|nr:uncharacterized protein Panc/cmk_0 isoform X2 [Zeugodacus cucurbitae]
MSPAKREKLERITKQQMQCYMLFCKQHPKLTGVKTESCNKSDTSQTHELWTQLVERLNEMQGPTQSVKMWKETLAHWKSQVRSHLRRYQKQTGRNIITSASYNKRTEISVVSEIKAEQNVDDKSADNDSCTSSSSRSTSFPHKTHKKNMKTKAPNMNYTDICSIILNTLEARREREEALYTNQINLISKLDQTLTLMTSVFEKVDRKLDKS